MRSEMNLNDQPRLLECIPNFSEGNDLSVIEQIKDAINSTPGVKLLHVDIGASANRTVMTFIGIPEAVVEAAFASIQVAASCIDMRKHLGEHPRMGATDVCPLVPYKGVSISKAVQYSQELGRRVGEKLGIPVYLYEHTATQENRKNLASIRSGEYEGFQQKITKTEWKPDYGPSEFNPQAGQTVIGARDFLIAYNINLKTKDVAIAKAIAGEIRESGTLKRIDGKRVLDASGNPIRIPGQCKGLKAIGWYMEEFGIAQVSMNLTNLDQTSLHLSFHAAKAAAARHGIEVSGSELIGMVPLQSMIEAGKDAQLRRGLPDSLSDERYISLAINELGLDDLYEFDPIKKIIEYQISYA